MVSRQDISPAEQPIATDQASVAVNDMPYVFLPDSSFLFDGTFEQVGFALVITNSDGEVFIVEDYFSFHPPPNLMVASGAGFSPEMVMHKLHLPFGEDVMFAGPATSAAALVEIGQVTMESKQNMDFVAPNPDHVIGKIMTKRINQYGGIPI